MKDFKLVVLCPKFMKLVFPALTQADFCSTLLILALYIPQTNMQPCRAKAQPDSGLIL